MTVALIYPILVLLFFFSHKLRVKQRARFGNPFGLQTSLVFMASFCNGPDLRHSFAVASIQAGDDLKTVQSNLGHATATFTLDVYGHVTQEMKEASAKRLETFIKGVSGL